jgi:hypothetical protein
MTSRGDDLSIRGDGALLLFVNHNAPTCINIMPHLHVYTTPLVVQ